MPWKIELYQKANGTIPVAEFIESLPPKHRAKAIRSIDLLEEFGTGLREPYAKSIQGSEYKGLWELRVKFASDISRVFYFLAADDKFVLLHGFLKKTMATPRVELDTARQYKADYYRRKEHA